MPSEKFWADESGRKKTIKKAKAGKIEFDGEKVRDGLAQLVLTLIELLRDLMERQAMRRIEGGSLTEEQIENMGTTFMKLKAETKKLKEHFNLKDEDLDLDLGPLGHLRETDDDFHAQRASVVDILDRILGKGVVVKGDVIISVADVDLISLHLDALLASVEKARELHGGSRGAEKIRETIMLLGSELKKPQGCPKNRISGSSLCRSQNSG